MLESVRADNGRNGRELSTLTDDEMRDGRRWEGDGEWIAKQSRAKRRIINVGCSLFKAPGTSEDWPSPHAVGVLLSCGALTSLGSPIFSMGSSSASMAYRGAPVGVCP
jgi:hypothetical protein